MHDAFSNELSILHEHSHYLLVNKPSGLFSQAAPSIDSLESRLISLLTTRDAHPGTPFIGLPHRLDRGTSGIMLIARNARALKRFGEQFQSRKVAKYYLAVLEGKYDRGFERWEDYVRKIPERPVAEICSRDTPGAKLASLDVQPLDGDKHFTLVLLQLHTGRMHQIRVQAASRGFPVLGDWVYGSTTQFGILDCHDQRQCMALHSLRIEFRHPQTGKLVAGTAQTPSIWLDLPPFIATAARSMFERSQSMPDTPFTFVESIKRPQ